MRDGINEEFSARILGTEYLKLCLDVTAYWTGSMFIHREGVIGFYNKALALIGHDLTHFVAADMTQWSAVDAQTFELIPRWLDGTDRREDYYSLNFEKQLAPDLPSDTGIGFWAVEYQRQPVGAVRLILPINSMNCSAQALMDLAVDALATLNFDSGHCGYSLNWHYLSRRYAMAAARMLGSLARRFPGVDLPHMVCTLMAVPYGIKRINWLTFLGHRLLDRAGGIVEVKKQLAHSDAVIESMAGGAVLRAGPGPAVGDVNRGERLLPYHDIGLALAGVRSHKHPPFLLPAKGEDLDELTAEWLAYFDE